MLQPHNEVDIVRTQLSADVRRDPRSALPIWTLEAERHYELDPVTAMFSRVDSGRFRVGPVRWSVAYEGVSIQDRGSLRALGSQLAIGIHGVQLAAGYRLVWTRDLAFPPSRFQAGVDWLF